MLTEESPFTWLTSVEEYDETDCFPDISSQEFLGYEDSLNLTDRIQLANDIYEYMKQLVVMSTTNSSSTKSVTFDNTAKLFQDVNEALNTNFTNIRDCVNYFYPLDNTRKGRIFNDDNFSKLLPYLKNKNLTDKLGLISMLTAIPIIIIHQETGLYPYHYLEKSYLERMNLSHKLIEELIDWFDDTL